MEEVDESIPLETESQRSQDGHIIPLEIVSQKSQDNNSNNSEKRWQVFGRNVPRSEIVFFCQVIIIYVVVCICLFNLSTDHCNSNLWSSLLSGCLGYLLPNPTIKR
jgi:hypothetical protein